MTITQDSILFGRIKYVARLREQKRLVKIVFNYPTLIGRDSREDFFQKDFNASEGMVADDDLMRYCSKHKIFNGDDEDTLSQQTSDQIIARKHKLNILLASCEAEQFLIRLRGKTEYTDWELLRKSQKYTYTDFQNDTLPKKEVEITRGWTVDEPGTDLLHPLGYIKSFLGKYSFLTGALALIIFQAILYIFGIHLPA